MVLRSSLTGPTLWLRVHSKERATASIEGRCELQARGDHTSPRQTNGCRANGHQQDWRCYLNKILTFAVRFAATLVARAVLAALATFAACVSGETRIEVRAVTY